MLKKLIVILCIAAVFGCFVSGCKKDTTKAQSKAEYEAQAKKEITKENMVSELDKLEQNIEQDAAATQ